MKITSFTVSIIFMMIGLLSCENNTVYEDTEGEGVRQFIKSYPHIKAPFRSVDELSQSVANVFYVSSYSDDDLWALSDCKCMNNFKGQKLASINGARGPLPEVMTSPVRKEILENNLLKLASSILGNLGQSIANELVEDETVREAIVEGLAEGLLESVPGGTNMSTSDLRLDGFIKWNSAISKSDGFILDDQISKWMTIFSNQNIFEGAGSSFSEDHGLQTFHIIRSLVELQYMYGIDGYSGIGLSVSPNYQFGLRSYDPRFDDNARTVFGSYTISFDNGISLLGQAVNPAESWSHGRETLEISEQAKLWAVMAKIFGSLRPNSRDHIGKMFEDNGGLLPDDSHLLALTVLPSVSEILAEKLIEKDSRKVLSQIDQYGNASVEAGPLEIARMVNAVQLWAQELKVTDDIDVNEDLKRQLDEAGPSFKDAVRLSVQHLISSYFSKDSIGEVTILPSVEYDLSAAGEIVEALLRVNKNLIYSELLSEMTQEIVRSYFSYATYKLSESTREVSFSDIVWLKRVSNELKGYDLNKLGLVWIDDVSAVLDLYMKR